MHLRISLPFMTALLVLLPAGARASDAVLVADLDVGTGYSSNIFMNSDRTQGFSLSPALTLGVDFKDFWTAGYAGVLRVAVDDVDLTNHSHSLFLLANPAWGTDGQNEFIARVMLNTQRFMQPFSSINNLRPVLDAGVFLEPVSWFRWSLMESLSYNWFYDDQTMDYLDFWSRTAFQFTFQSRTTVTPRLAYGFRRYSRAGSSQGDDREDHQMEAGIHFSQGLWKNGGLQIDYSYLHSFDVAGLISRNQNVTSFSYLEDSFMFSGHQAYLGLKQVVGLAWTFSVAVNFSSRFYDGWAALDSSGASLGEDRLDYRLGTRFDVEYMFRPGADRPASIPGVGVVVGYGYVRQWSNHWYYDTDQHSVALDVRLHW